MSTQNVHTDIDICNARAQYYSEYLFTIDIYNNYNNKLYVSMFFTMLIAIPRIVLFTQWCNHNYC